MFKKASKGEYLDLILRSPQTIFSASDVALLWGEPIIKSVRLRLDYYVKKGNLLRVYRGFYAKDANYNIYELATRIYTPAYISFETVLTRQGVNFQHYDTIFVASYVNREISVGAQTITYVRMKDYVLSNMLSVDSSSGFAVATKERALLDRLYVSKEYHFDNLKNLDWKRIFELVPSYHNQRLEKKVNEYHKASFT